MKFVTSRILVPALLVATLVAPVFAQGAYQGVKGLGFSPQVSIIDNHDGDEKGMKVGAHLGFDTDSSELFFGVNGVLANMLMLAGAQIALNPEFSYWLVDSPSNVSSSFWMLAVSGLYPLALEFAKAYIGAGLAITHWSVSYDGFDGSDLFSKNQIVVVDDFSTSSTDVGLILKGGAELEGESLTPFGEVGFVISDSSWLFLQGGVRFAI